MNSRSMQRTLIAILAATLMLAAGGGTAFARTVPASAGTATSGLQRQSFNFIVQGVSISSGVGGWIIPLPMEGAGSKTISVHGKVNSGSSMACTAVSVSNVGTTLGQSSQVAFSATGTFQTITLPLSSAVVPSTAFVNVVCLLAGGGATLLGTGYNQ